MRRPSFQFYPEAWLSDIGLRGCSSAARGLWADMLCLLHQGTPYGHLRLEAAGGEFYVPDDETLGRMTGNKPADVRRWLAELEEKGVANRDEDGTIYSRKMVRDEAQRESWRRRQERARQKDGSGKAVENEISTGTSTRNPQGVLEISTGEESASERGRSERRYRRKSNGDNESDPDGKPLGDRDVTPHVTPGVTPSSPRSPSPTPTLQRRSSTAGAAEDLPAETSTAAAGGIWWNESALALDCLDATLSSLLETYRDAGVSWVKDRWTYHSGWLRDHPDRLAQLRRGGLAEWVKNRIREDYSKAVSKPRTADEQIAEESRRRRRRDRNR